MLQSLGYDALCAADAESAFYAVARLGSRLRFAVVDLMMPKIDGAQLVRAVRHGSPVQRLPIVVASAVYPDDSTIVRGVEKEGCVFLRKPFKVADLRDAILVAKQTARLMEEPVVWTVGRLEPVQGAM